MGLIFAIVLLSLFLAPITVPMMIFDEWLPEAIGYLIYAVKLPWDLLIDLF